MTDRMEDDRPLEGGARPVPEHRAEVPKGGRTVGQTIVIALVILIVIAAVLWIAVPFAG